MQNSEALKAVCRALGVPTDTPLRAVTHGCRDLVVPTEVVEALDRYRRMRGSYELPVAAQNLAEAVDRWLG